MPKKIKYNPADRMADLAMMRMQGRIKQVYAEAEQDITKKLNAFIARFREKDAEYQAGVKAGKIAQADYDAWRRGQIFQGKRWRAMRQEMTEQIYRANKTAAGIINGERRVVFQQNANYLAYQIEKGTRGAVSFGLYDSATVTRLLKEDRKLLPEYKINQRKDYKWNNQKVNSAVTQSIVQGESIDALAKRMTTSLEAGNRSHMLNFARTAMTGAQNAGRIEAMHDAEDMGIKVRKRWIATLDSRTRDTHAELDGKVVDVDEPFEVDGMTIMYPGDPNADPSLVYNCRCTLGYEYPEYSGQGKRLDNETGNVIEYTTYKDWEQSKLGTIEENPQIDNILHFDFTPAKTIEEAETFARQFLQSDKNGTVSYKGIDLEFANTENKVLNDVFGQYSPKYKLGKIAPMNRREKLFKSAIESSEACYHWAGDGGLYLNPNFYKSRKALDAHVSEINSLMDVVLNGGQELLDSGKYTGNKRTYIEALLNTGRQCVSQSYDFVEGTIVHESGHMLDDKLFRKTMKDIDSPLSKLSELTKSREKYGGKISGYAVASNNEYIAESFTAWWYGETEKIDPELVRVFEEAKKK